MEAIMALTHLRMDGMRVFEEDDKRMKVLGKRWGVKKNSQILRMALEESVRNLELHQEVNGLKNELAEVKESLESVNMLLQDLYYLVGAKIQDNSTTQNLETN